MNKKTFVVIVSILLFTTLAFSIPNLDNPHFWFDEAVHFWIAKGLNPDSDPVSETGTLSDVIKNNTLYSKDPGGFSILLHFWSAISNTHIWLRTLPFIFFLGLIAAFIYLSYLWTSDLRNSLMMGFIPLLDKFILAEGFELRPYSMEYLGILLGVIAYYTLPRNFTFRNLFLWSLVLSLFTTSRYSIIVVFFVISVFLIWELIKERLTFDHIFKVLITWGTPLLLTIFIILQFSLRIQNPGLEEMSYLPYLKEDISHLFQPRFNLVFFAMLVTISILPFIINRSPFSNLKKYLPLFLISVFVAYLFLIFSLLGFYPWTPNDKYGLPFSMLIILSTSVILGEILRHVLKSRKIWVHGFMLMLLFLSLFNDFNERYFHRFHYRDSRKILNCLESLDYSKYPKIYVDRWASPSIKYLFEYGIFSANEIADYPNSFDFQKWKPHSRSNKTLYVNIKRPTLDDLVGYDLLIIPELARLQETNGWVDLKYCEDYAFQKSEENLD